MQLDSRLYDHNVGENMTLFEYNFISIDGKHLNSRVDFTVLTLLVAVYFTLSLSVLLSLWGNLYWSYTSCLKYQKKVMLSYIEGDKKNRFINGM